MAFWGIPSLARPGPGPGTRGMRASMLGYQKGTFGGGDEGRDGKEMAEWEVDGNI